MRIVLFALLGATLGLGACSKSKPSEEECRQAVENIRALTGLDKSEIGADPEAMVRSCRARSTRESVQCAIAAESTADLERCEGETGQEYFKEEAERDRKLREKREEEERKEREKAGGG